MIDSDAWPYFAYALYLAWLTAGALDFHLHRRTGLSKTSGVRESALHGAQLACVGAGVLLWLSFYPNLLVSALVIGLAGGHAMLGYWDTCVADGVRRVSPLEQHVHSVLDACPWIFAVAICASAEPGWQGVLRPRPTFTWVIVLAPAMALVVLPWLLEFIAAWRDRSQRSRAL